MVHVVISSRVRPVVFRQTSVSGHPTRVFVCNYRDKAVCSLSGFTSSNSKNMPETLSEGGEDLGHASHESAIVKWDLEEPSEFRPGLDVVGKDAESFRGFYDVSSVLSSHVAYLTSLYCSLRDTTFICSSTGD